MPTLAKLKNQVSELSFIHDMEYLGFSLGSSGFWFFRRRGDVLDVAVISVGSSGHWAKLSISPFIEEQFDQYDMNNFPKGFLKVHSNPLSTYLTKNGVEHPWHEWNVKEHNNIVESFNKLSELMIKKGDAWLKAIKTKNDVLTLLSQ